MSKAPRKHVVQTPGAEPLEGSSAGAPVLVGLNPENPTTVIAGQTMAMNDVVRSAFDTSEYSLEEWNALPVTERDALIQAQVSEIESVSGIAEDAGQSKAELARARIWPRKPRGKKPDGKPDLPKPSEVDPAKITRATQTTAGWVVPSKPLRVPGRGE